MKMELVFSKIPKIIMQRLVLGLGRLSDLELDPIRLAAGGYAEIVAAATETNIFTNATVPQFPTGYDYVCEGVTITNNDPLNQATVDLYDGATGVAANQRGNYIVPPGATISEPASMRFATDVRALSTVGAVATPVSVQTRGKLIP